MIDKDGEMAIAVGVGGEWAGVVEADRSKEVEDGNGAEWRGPQVAFCSETSGALRHVRTRARDEPLE